MCLVEFPDKSAALWARQGKELAVRNHSRPDEAAIRATSKAADLFLEVEVFHQRKSAKIAVVYQTPFLPLAIAYP